MSVVARLPINLIERLITVAASIATRAVNGQVIHLNRGQVMY